MKPQNTYKKVTGYLKVKIKKVQSMDASILFGVIMCLFMCVFIAFFTFCFHILVCLLMLWDKNLEGYGVETVITTFCINFQP